MSKSAWAKALVTIAALTLLNAGHGEREAAEGRLHETSRP